jgi:hypothetical protein
MTYLIWYGYVCYMEVEMIIVPGNGMESSRALEKGQTTTNVGWGSNGGEQKWCLSAEDIIFWDMNAWCKTTTNIGWGSHGGEQKWCLSAEDIESFEIWTPDAMNP